MILQKPKKKYLIIGTSAAGIAAAGQLRKLDPEIRIICISRERELPYNKCLLANFCAQKVSTEQVFLKNYENIELLLNTEVISISPEKQALVLSTGVKMNYDALFLGLGSKPKIPPLFNKTIKGIFTFHNLFDIQKIIKYSQHNKISRVTVIGAGINGLECADALNQRGLSVTVLDQSSQILPSWHQQELSLFLQNKFLESGITIECGKTVEEIISSYNKIKALKLSSGKEILTDIVVLATGVEPATEFLQNSGILLENNFVIVNNYLQTSVPTIFAGGDCILTKNRVTNAPTPNSTWADAMLQGIYAAHNMAGITKAYSGIIPSVTTTLTGLPFVSFGTVQEAAYYAMATDRVTFYELCAFNKNHNLQGFVLIGKLEKVSSLKKTFLQSL